MSTTALVVLILLVVVVLGSFPMWPHSRGWGYGPFGILLGLLLVLALLKFLGVLHL